MPKAHTHTPQSYWMKPAQPHQAKVMCHLALRILSNTALQERSEYTGRSYWSLPPHPPPLPRGESAAKETHTSLWVEHNDHLLVQKQLANRNRRLPHPRANLMELWLTRRVMQRSSCLVRKEKERSEGQELGKNEMGCE